MARILVAEDNQQIRDSLQQWFTHIGYEIVTVENGNLASKAIQDQDYDVLLLDWEMGPGKTGPEVVRQYRERGGNGIVIILTGRGGLSDKETGFDAGVDDYIVKPFHLKEISAKVKALLKRLHPAEQQELDRQGLKQMAPAKRIISVRSCGACDTIYDITARTCEDCLVSLDPEDIEFLGGEQFNDKYEITSVLGRGGMSIVFNARHRVLNKDFAIKFLDASRSNDTEYLKRFQLEAQALSRMNHEHVVAIHDYGVIDSKHPYIVMDFVEGMSLFRAINRLEPFPVSRCLNIFKQSCLGIGHAHKKGIIHRDLKPANIVLGKHEGKEKVMIVDFGVAQRIATEDKPAERLTKEGKVFGTTTYMSPEHCLGQNLDERSDIYAFGCIMYEVLSGHPPFIGNNVLDTLQMQINDKPLPLSLLRENDELPKELEQIVHKTLEKFPANRFQNMEELLAALESVG